MRVCVGTLELGGVAETRGRQTRSTPVCSLVTWTIQQEGGGVRGWGGCEMGVVRGGGVKRGWGSESGV